MVRFLASLALAATAIVLSACYTSSYMLLDTSAGVTPLSDGAYASSIDRKYLSARSDGSYDMYYVDKNGSTTSSSRMWLNRAADLESSSNYVYFYAKEDSGGWLYGLLVNEGGAIYEVHPDCSDGNVASIAASEGASLSGDDFTDCRFSDGESLRRALRRYYRTAAYLTDPYYRQ
ncbi:MAG TPA: hypothetical protein VF138_00835 [Caulobacteraceae bacterium]